MGTPVTQAPSAFLLAAVRTGEPVNVASMSRLAEEGAFLLGHNLVKCGEAHCPLRPSARVQLEGLTFSTYVPYTRSPGAQVVRICVELHDSNEIGDSQTVAVTLPSGAAWIDHAGLDGSVTFFNPPAGRTSPREIVAWADVSGVTAALTDVVKVTTTPLQQGAGVRRVSVHESPLSSLAVSASEPGWDAAATRAGRPVIDGGSSSPRGTQRLFHILDAARASWRQHLTLSGVESANTASAGTTPHWHRESSTEGPLDWMQTSGVNDPCWYLQVRDLYAGAPAAWKLRVRYRTSTSADCELKLYHQGGAITSRAWVGAGSEGFTALALPGTSGSWAWATAVSASLPVDGTDGLVRVRVRAKGPGSGQLLSIACVDLREDES